MDMIAQALNAHEERFQLDVDNLEDMLFVQRVEDDHVINPVKEFRSKGPFECVFDDTSRMRFCLFGLRRSGKANALTEILKLACADVGGHDQNGVSEIDLTSQAVGQLSFIKYLQ